MFKSITLSLLVLLTACKSTDGGPTEKPLASGPVFELIPKETDGTKTQAQTPAAAPESAAPVALTAKVEVDCKPEDAPVCPEEEHSNPFRCVVLKSTDSLLADSEQIVGYGTSPCQARREAFLKACSAKIAVKAPEQISCHPFANEGECPAKLEDCDSTEEPSRCFATAYDDEKLNEMNRPEAWGKNECEARNALKTLACGKGLNPTKIKPVVCEKEKSAQVCPPHWRNCVIQKDEYTVCSLKAIGAETLHKPIEALGANRCEATYRVVEAACRLQKEPMTTLSGIECKSTLAR